MITLGIIQALHHALFILLARFPHHPLKAKSWPRAFAMELLVKVPNERIWRIKTGKVGKELTVQ